MFKKLLLTLMIVCTVSLARADENYNHMNTNKDKADNMYSDNKKQCLGNNMNYDEVVSFSKKLQEAVRNDDSKTIAKVVDYPLKVYKRVRDKIICRYINTPQQFLNEYKGLITKRTKKLILDTVVEDAFCNYLGSMIGAGSIWFAPQHPNGGELKIFQLNVINNFIGLKR